MQSIVSTQGLCRRFGKTEALAGIDLQVAPGELVGIVGPDGAGKTTLMRLLAGVMAPTAGTVTWGNTATGTPARRGYLSAHFSLYPDLTVMENILFFARLHGQSEPVARRHALHWLAWIGLDTFTDRLAGQLSGGMKQKLSLVTALVNEADVLLLDEPTTAVDPVSRREFWSLILDLVGQGRTAVITTPYMDEAERCHRVALLHEGRVLQTGTPDHLRRALPGQVVRVTAPHLDRKALQQAGLQVPGARWSHAFGAAVHVMLTTPLEPERLAAVLQALGLRGEAVLPSLEDVFLAHMSETEVVV